MLYEPEAIGPIGAYAPEGRWNKKETGGTRRLGDLVRGRQGKREWETCGGGDGLIGNDRGL
jgi:hypothetical protein